MSQPTLSIREIKQLSKILREVFLYQKTLKKKEPLARFIKNPQIPPALSESLAYYLVNERSLIPELKSYQLARGVNNRDITATSKNIKKIVEVKSTSSKGWQRLSQKDITADYLLWINFGTYFESDDQSTIDVYIIPSPGKYYHAREDVFVPDIRTKVGQALRHVQVDLGHTPNTQ